MSTIVGQSLIYALEEAVKNQDEINSHLISLDVKESTISISNEQKELLISLLRLCECTF